MSLASINLKKFWKAAKAPLCALALIFCIYIDLFGSITRLIILLANDRSANFLFFFSAYVFSTAFGFLLLSFFGLYGALVLCVIPAFLFWGSLCSNISFFVLKNGSLTIKLFKWFKLNGLLEVSFELYIDLISFSFMLLTTTIACFVLLYAFSYFRYEPNVERLLLLLNSFVLSMIILVISGNLVVMFFGWEMIGLTSFLLINFWLTRVGTLKAAFKAYTFNKISDVSFFFAILLVYYSFNEINFVTLSSLAIFFNDNTINFFFEIRAIELISFFFLTAAFIKSAQIGFHVWLPDSMEAPVPASALIHSATLVSAGIFLVVRLQPIFELSTYFHTVAPVIGALTAFLGGFGAFYQTDLKRVLAYSTISHCGFLFFLASFNCVEYTLVYLYIHGFFKASSFLCVGNIIRFSQGYQDVRRMGFFWKYLPFELFMLAFCLLNLSGLPLFFGFLIKHFLFLSFDFIVLKLLTAGFIFLAAFSGIFYSFKIFYYVFFDSKKARSSVYFAYTSEEMNSAFYANSTLGGMLAIFCLVFFAAFISFIFFFWVFINYSSMFAEVHVSLGKAGIFQAYNFDLGVLFNFKLLNTVICIFFFFLNFFRWNKLQAFSYENFFFIIILLLIF